MGTLYWQLNDCWPVTSWSSRDYYGNWKALQFELNRLYATLLISIYQDPKGDYNVHVISDSVNDLNAQLVLELYDFEGRKTWYDEKEFLIAANSSEVAYSLHPKDLPRNFNSKKTLLLVTLKYDSVQTIKRHFYFEKPKDLNLPKPAISKTIQYISDHSPFENFPFEYEITVTADHFAKDIYLEFSYEEVKFSDNFFDLLPGEKKVVRMFSKQAIDYVNLPLEARSLADSY
jgi:beta-mannosidase